MYDTSFDREDSNIPPVDRRLLWAVRIAAAGAVLFAATADAQIPGAPVLQNVWATPGIVGAVNVTGGSGISSYLAAGSWTPNNGRFEVSGGIGATTGQQRATGAAYGVRVAMPFGGASSSFGFGAFAGIGGSSGQRSSTVVPCGGGLPGSCTVDSVGSTLEVPIGAAIGWRHAIGTAHGVSVYATPTYLFLGGAKGAKSGGLFRTALGVDVGITSRIGATAGVEFGGSRPRGAGGPTGTLYGLGVSYAFRSQ